MRASGFSIQTESILDQSANRRRHHPSDGTFAWPEDSRSFTAAADAEQILINLHAVPSFDAFGRALQTASPFVFWIQAAQIAWLPWLEAASAFMFPPSVTSATPKLGTRLSSRGGARNLGTDRAVRSKGA